MFVRFPSPLASYHFQEEEVAYSGGDATDDVGVASCETVSKSLSPMSMSLGTVSNNNNNNNACIHT